MSVISVMTMVYGGDLAKGKLTDVEMLSALEAMGFDGVELWADHILESPGRQRAYQDYLAGSELRVTCIDAVGNFATRDPKARQGVIDGVLRTCAFADAVNCPLVLTAGSRLEEGMTPEEGRKRIIDALNEATSRKGTSQVGLAIEDFGIERRLQCAAKDCLEVLDGVTGLAFVFDTGNFYFAGEDPMANLATLFARTRHVHIKDWTKSAKPDIADVASCPVGTGCIPNHDIVRRLIASGYDGAFSLETGGPGERMEAVRADIGMLRRWP